MTRQVTLEEAQTQLPVLVEAAKQGETIVIAQNDQPVVQLVAVPPIKRQAQFGSATGLVVMADDFDAPLSDFAEYTA
jgi:antitoxin (DNA-binding transcriptional repressor) of toxin-antitoxin stability system